MDKKLRKRIFLHWNRESAPQACIERLESLMQEGIFEVEIFAPERVTVYSDICAPLAGIFEWYAKKKIRFKFTFPGENNYVRHTSIQKPYVVEELLDSSELKFPLDKVWKYSTPEGVNALVTSIINALRESAVLEPGVLSSTEWCINEVMDNVLQHSNAQYGYVMGQLHRGTKRISICVFDMGVGIYNTLKKSKHIPRKPLDAITLALQERVTRDESVGQGNGMWGLNEIIKENGGRIRILSNGALYSYKNGIIDTKEDYPMLIGKYKNATVIDFQIDYSKTINIAHALNGYIPTDYWIENRETDDGTVYFEVKKDSAGTGTRTAAEKFRNVITNTLKEGNYNIVLDFSGVNVVSSSYADELVGKLVVEYGFVYFLTHFQLQNLSPWNIGVVNRSVEQRMGHKYYDTILED